MLQRLTFGAKLMLGSLGMVLLAVIVLTVVNLWQVQGVLEGFARTTLSEVGDTMYRDMQAQHELLTERLAGDVNVFARTVDEIGLIHVYKRRKEPMTIVNQVTGQAESLEVPKLLISGKAVTDNKLVDRLAEQFSAATTFFQVLPGKLLRISTSVRTQNGERAVGTYIPEGSPVYKAVMAGETYLGRAFVVDRWMLTAYLPLKDIKDEVKAVVFVGRELLTPQLEKSIGAVNIGQKGYAFVYDAKGNFLVHPDQAIRGTNLSDHPFGDQLGAVNNGFAHYEFQGKPKTAYARHFEPWDWHLAVGMDDADMLLGADTRLLTAALIAAGLLTVLAAGLAVPLARITAGPLRRLEAYTAAVAQGDFNAAIEYPADDVIGRTIGGVQAMVGELKTKLGYSKGILDGMAVPCLVVDREEKATFVNQACLDMLELDGRPQDFLGRTLADIFYKDPGRRTKIGEVMAGGEAQRGIEVTIDSHKGSKRHILANLAPLKDLDGVIIGGFCLYVDVTAQHEQRERIEAQNGRIARMAGEATQISELVSSAAEELSAQVEEASRGSELQSGRAAETSASMEQMNATVLDVAKSASGAAESAEQARTKAQAGEDMVRRVITAIEGVRARAEELDGYMNELGGEAEGIGRIIGVIQDIADQTNLLALNAAIEAARAGDAGRGFAVVADEVRKLAEKTMTATQEVGQAVTAIQQGAEKSFTATRQASEAVADSTQLAEESGRALHDIVQIVDGTAGQVQAIAAASEEQSAASDEIGRAVEDMSRISMETSDGMTQSARAVADLASQAGQLKTLIDELRG